MLLTLITPFVTMWALSANAVSEVTLRAYAWAAMNTSMVLTPQLLPLEACWPSNNLLSDSQLGVLTRMFGGALGGIINDVVNFAMLALAVIAIITMLSKRGPEFLRKLPGPALVVIYALVILIAYNAAYELFRNRC